MRKSLYHNRLRTFRTSRRRLRGFSLAELVVSIGILLMMFSLAGQVFSLTMESTGQAKAFTEINQLLRIFETSLREDLRNVEPGQSVMLIQANPVNAYWTSDGLESDDDGDPSPPGGYPHTSDPQREDADGKMIAPRADMLMFFTARKGTSFVDPDVTANLQQVVYGHAELGEYVNTNTTGTGPPTYDLLAGPNAAFPVDVNTGYPSPTLPSRVPARQWHLGRRSTLLLPMDIPGSNAAAASVTELLQSQADALIQFSYEQLVTTPCIDPQCDVPPWGPPWYLPESITPGNPVQRSQLDVTPPAVLARRLGHYFIPNCASFKVEWTLDPRSEFVDGRLDDMTEILWFDQGDEADPLASLTRIARPPNGNPPPNLFSLLDDDTFHPDGTPYSLEDRFGANPPGWLRLAADGRPNLVAFGAARRNQNDDIVPEDIFPGALRITIDLYDDTQRLDRPIRHVMIIPVGG